MPNFFDNPCIALYGAGPENTRCQNCVHLHRIHVNWKPKCDLRPKIYVSKNGPDHYAKWPACAKFEPRQEATVLLLEREPEDEHTNPLLEYNKDDQSFQATLPNGDQIFIAEERYFAGEVEVARAFCKAQGISAAEMNRFEIREKIQAYLEATVCRVNYWLALRSTHTRSIILVPKNQRRSA